MVKKITTVTIVATSFPKENYTLFGLIKAILYIILAKLVRTVSKFALKFIWTLPKLYKFFA